MEEIWKDVVGYEGIYEVSNTGKVRTKEGKTTSNARFNVRHWKQRELKLKQDRMGYKRVCLWIDGKNHDWLVHRVVATAFIPNPNNYDCINHIDGKSDNECVENLEWCDFKHNSNHAFDNDLMGTNKKVKLIRVCDGLEFKFRSMVKASNYLGRNDGYIVHKIKTGKTKLICIDGLEYTFELI